MDIRRAEEREEEIGKAAKTAEANLQDINQTAQLATLDNDLQGIANTTRRLREVSRFAVPYAVCPTSAVAAFSDHSHFPITQRAVPDVDKLHRTLTCSYVRQCAGAQPAVVRQRGRHPREAEAAGGGGQGGGAGGPAAVPPHPPAVRAGLRRCTFASTAWSSHLLNLLRAHRARLLSVRNCSGASPVLTAHLLRLLLHLLILPSPFASAPAELPQSMKQLRAAADQAVEARKAALDAARKVAQDASRTAASDRYVPTTQHATRPAARQCATRGQQCSVNMMQQGVVHSVTTRRACAPCQGHRTVGKTGAGRAGAGTCGCHCPTYQRPEGSH